MAIQSQARPPGGVGEQPLLPGTRAALEQAFHDIRAVNEQLLIAGLREQTLAEQLRRQLAFTTAITTSLGEGVYVLDTTGRCTFVNPAAEQMLGWTEAELREQNISVVFPLQAAQPTSRDTLPAKLLSVLRFSTTQRDEEALFVHHNGGSFPASYSAAPIITDGVVVGAVITFRDMTEMRRLQQTREEYLALISHDLRAPLTVILGRAQIIERRLTQQGLLREAESAKIMVESGFRMNAMIEDVLERSRTATTRDARLRSTIDLVALVQQMLEQSIAPDDRLRVTLDAVASLAVVADAAQIQRVIVNLLSNALKFSAPATPVVVAVYRQAREAIVAVTDQGSGIAPEEVPHLFNKHYRAATVEQVAGNGLGLYSSRLIVEAHGGRIWAESTVGVGSTFTVALPLSG